MAKQKVKKIIAIFLVLTSVFLAAACGSNPPKTDASGFADQKAFLEDMAKGIKNRLAVSDKDPSSMSDEEHSKYYLELVGYELKQIEKYANATFEDTKFNELAHEYISACQMQRTGAENIRNKVLYDALWNGGLTARSGIITYFYEQYSLPITSEEVANYSSGNTVTYTVSSVTDTQNNEVDSGTLGERVIEVDVTKGNNTIINEDGLVISFDGILKHNKKLLVGLTFDNTTGKDLYISMSNLKFDRTAISAGNTSVELLDDTLYTVGPHFNFVVDQEDVTSNKINKLSFALTIWTGGWYKEPYATYLITITANLTL